ncbi:TPA_asm: coat protein [ssRNA phage Esthiorhiza.2_34]|uniref:Coat protein n=2 Tax=Leviviricetes TaxID=2842243 RepID=A0A8S5L0W6_9VIRU|nr:coat protein [ssRNA phage Esthiorhiza.2_34]QDH89625.1 MAG: hypothetical protein H2RhizoLitter492048_000002 [Leviviridae sp.]DAD51550.1 TPA_asm: coat protein [ssRNA phage Esthiorhiza.2_34]
MFADTITLTGNSVAHVLTRINQDGYSSEYYLRETAGEYRMFIRNSRITDKKRPNVVIDQHNVDLTHTLFPAVPGDPPVIRRSFWTLQNQQGDTLVDPKYDADALLAFISTSGNIAKMQNFEC